MLRHVEVALLHDVGIVGEVHVDVEPLVHRLRRHRPAEGMWQAYVSARWRGELVVRARAWAGRRERRDG